MSGVVLRCPNCGTTKSATGECEACHEAQVRYYCTNHSPGRWLDTSACTQCGARFGDPPRPTVVTPPPPPPRRARGSAPPTPRAPTAARTGPPRGGLRSAASVSTPDFAGPVQKSRKRRTGAPKRRSQAGKNCFGQWRGRGARELKHPPSERLPDLDAASQVAWCV